MSSSNAAAELGTTADGPGNATPLALRSWRTPAPVLPDPAGSLELPHTVDGALDLETAGLNLAERLASETTLLSGKSAAEAWLKEIGLSLGGMVQGKLGRMSLQLHPAELGAMEIEILTQEGVASVDFAAVQPATRDLLEASLPRLRELLLQQGLQLGDVVVRDQARQQQEQQRQRDEQFRQNIAADGDKPDAVTMTMRSPRLNRSALLDAYV
jgi:flagellar hook-length control protein FliK